MTSKPITAMNLNSATEQELTQLPRVGADKARRIVRYRAIRQGFRDWADFGGTRGITAADVTAIRTRAWIGPAPAGLRPIRDRRRASGTSGAEVASAAGFWQRARGRAGVRRPDQRG